MWPAGFDLLKVRACARHARACNCRARYCTQQAFPSLTCFGVFSQASHTASLGQASLFSQWYVVCQLVCCARSVCMVYVCSMWCASYVCICVWIAVPRNDGQRVARTTNNQSLTNKRAPRIPPTSAATIIQSHADRFNVNVSFSKNWEHLQNKHVGTGHPDMAKL